MVGPRPLPAASSGMVDTPKEIGVVVPSSGISGLSVLSGEHDANKTTADMRYGVKCIRMLSGVYINYIIVSPASVLYFKRDWSKFLLRTVYVIVVQMGYDVI